MTILSGQQKPFNGLIIILSQTVSAKIIQPTQIKLSFRIPTLRCFAIPLCRFLFVCFNPLPIRIQKAQIEFCIKRLFTTLFCRFKIPFTGLFIILLDDIPSLITQAYFILCTGIPFLRSFFEPIESNK